MRLKHRALTAGLLMLIMLACLPLTPARAANSTLSNLWVSNMKETPTKVAVIFDITEGSAVVSYQETGGDRVLVSNECFGYVEIDDLTPGASYTFTVKNSKTGDTLTETYTLPLSSADAGDASQAADAPVLSNLWLSNLEESPTRVAVIFDIKEGTAVVSYQKSGGERIVANNESYGFTEITDLTPGETYTFTVKSSKTGDILTETFTLPMSDTDTSEETSDEVDMSEYIGTVVVTKAGYHNARSYPEDQETVFRVHYGERYLCVSETEDGWYEIMLPTEETVYVSSKNTSLHRNQTDDITLSLVYDVFTIETTKKADVYSQPKSGAQSRRVSGSSETTFYYNRGSELTAFGQITRGGKTWYLFLANNDGVFEPAWLPSDACTVVSGDPDDGIIIPDWWYD